MLLLSPHLRPEILKEDIKVFFVKYNDPIYVKLEKLDIMIRLATPANIANVLAELKEWVTTSYFLEQLYYICDMYKERKAVYVSLAYSIICAWTSTF